MANRGDPAWSDGGSFGYYHVWLVLVILVSTVAALAEIWSLAAVSCDRLQAILYPLDKHKRITKLQVFYEYTCAYDVIEKRL